MSAIVCKGLTRKRPVRNPGLSAGIGLASCLLGTSVACAQSVTGTGNVSPAIPGGSTNWTVGAPLSVGNSGTGSLTIAGGGTVTSTGTSIIGTGSAASGTVTVTGTNSRWSNDAEIVVGFQGSGTLTVAAGGVATATTGYIGYSTFTGGAATVTGANSRLELSGELLLGFQSGGTLTIDAGGTVTSTITRIGSTLSGDGTLNLNGAVGGRGMLETGQILKGNGTGRMSFNGGGLRATSSQPTFVSGFNPGDLQIQVGGAFIDSNGHDIGISAGFSGSGGLTKQGVGTLTLTGANSYTGGTTIDAGVLQVGAGSNSGSILGDVVNNGQLAFNRSNAVTFGGTISGSGSVAQRGTSTLTLTGTNTYTGGTTIAAGALSISADANLGGSAGNLQLDGGALRVTGTALTQLGRTIAFGSNGGGFDIVDAGNIFTVTESFSGTGALSKAGAGTLLLTGTHSYSGGTTISGGVLQIGDGGASGSIAGDVVNNALLVFNRSGAMTFGDTISGTGSVIKRGAGALTLTDTNTYTGATSVISGTLIVNGSIASSSVVTVAAGATLGGSGTVPTTVINGGTLSPGNSPGTLTVNGNLTLNPGSTYVAEVQGAVADRVAVTGTAALAGTLRIVPLGGAYTFNSPYTLLSAAGGLGGSSFSPVDMTGSFGDGVTTGVNYTANEVRLTLAPKPLAPIVNPTPQLGVTAPANAYAIASAIDGAVANGGDPSSLFGIYNLPSAAIPAAVNSLSGEIHTAAPALAEVASDQFLRAMLDPWAAGRLGDIGGSGPGAASFSGLVRKGADQPAGQARLDAPAHSVWGSGYGSYGRTDGNAAVGSGRRRIDDAHLATGVDLRLRPGTIAGFAVSVGSARASLPGLLGKIDADVFQAGLYGVSQLGPVRLGAAASYARLDNEVSRGIPALGSSLSSSYDTTAWSGRLQASATVLNWNGFGLSPLAALQATRAQSPAVRESNWSGATAGALALGRRDDVTSRSELGLQLDADTMLGSVPVTGYVRAAWAHYFQRDADLTASLAGLPGAAFTATGAEADRNSALVAAGLSARLSERITLGLNLDGEIAAGSNRLGGSAQLKVSF